MPLNPKNYSLNNNYGNYNWMQTPQPQPVASAAPMAAASSGIPFEPMSAIGGGLLDTVGAGFDAWEANQQRKRDEAYRDKMFKYQEEQDKKQQRNVERGQGMNALNFMKDNYITALTRSKMGGL